MTRILGVDPGISGAIALLDTQTRDLRVLDLPTHEVKTSSRKIQKHINAAALASVIEGLRPDIACVEQVNAMPGQGVVSMFRFGQAYGLALGILAALKVPIVHASPVVWSRRVGLRAGKGASNLRASELFPKNSAEFSRVKDHGRADAALIAYFCELHLDGAI